MASRAGFPVLDLTNADQCQTWMMAFSAMIRINKWVDSDKQNAITDNFIAVCGFEALGKVISMLSPRNIQTVKYEEIERTIKSFLQPKTRLVIAERNKFFSLKQKESEGISDFILRLRKGAEFCQFSKLKESTDPTEDMITMSLIAGLHDSESKKRLLEKIGHSEPSVDEIKEFVQNMEQLKSFINKNVTLAESEEDNKELHYIRREQKSITKCKFCGSDHARGKCPAFGKKCLNCSKPNHFAIVCLSAQNKQSKQVNSVIESSTELDIGSIFVVNSCHKELVSCLINSNKIQMQIDTGADVSIISSKLWKDLGEPKLKHHNMKLTAYDGHIMKCLGYFTAEV